MAYVPVNTQAYVSAYAGALAGMAVSGWITDQSPVSYSSVAVIAGAFSQAFDQAWNDATPLNNLQLRSIQTVCQNEFASRGPGALNNPDFAQASNWTVPAGACSALAEAADTYFADQGIDPGTPGGGGSDVATGQLTGNLSGGLVDIVGVGGNYVNVGGTYNYSGSADFEAGTGSQLHYIGSGGDKLALVTGTVTLVGDNVSLYAVYMAINEIGQSIGGLPDEVVETVSASTGDFKTFTVTRLVGINNTSQSLIDLGLGVNGGTYGGLPVARLSMTAQVVATL
jgi:hypothetical protein